MNLLNSICYTIGWFWCVLLGIHGYALLAILGAVFLILIQLYYTKRKDISLYIQDVILLIFSIPLGILLEMFFIQTNILNYGTFLFPPAWIVALYPLFSLILNHSLRLIKKRAYIVGFLAPLSYFAGQSLGGLTFGYSPFLTWMFIGLSWGVFLYILIKIANSIEKAANETLDDTKRPLTLLYDGECPLCKREICMLKKRGTVTDFVDITKKDFNNPKVPYTDAMKEIHAIDAKGNLLVGIPAFAAVYARSQLLIISTLFRIPFIKYMITPLYTVFAKNRLWLTGRK